MLRPVSSHEEENVSVASAPTVDRLVTMMNGFRNTQVTYVVAKLGVADHLADVPLTAAEVAGKVHADADGLGRILRLAALFDLVAEEPGDRFRLTPMGEMLRTDSPRSLRAVAIQLGELHYAAWGDLLHSATTGESAFEHVYGAPLFDYLSRHPAAQTTFDAYMSANKDPFASALNDKYDFSRLGVLVDVGAGNGSVSAGVLSANPKLEAIIFDRPAAMTAAERFVAEAGLQDRCRLVAGDFFESVPMGGDVYMLSNVIHDWDDARAGKILRNCRASMKRNTPLILLETVLPPHGQPNGAVMADVNMLVMLTGQERTEGAYKSLLRASGFHPSRTIPISPRLSLIEALAD
jgi:SAM-dependent methyltransferase